MREIKFRAWDLEENEMVDQKMIDEMPHMFFDALTMPDDYVPMQYTGLKDKNGKEIYEGDIVYIAGYGMYQCVFPFLELYEAYPEQDIGSILGNVYENPELVEMKDW